MTLSSAGALAAASFSGAGTGLTGGGALTGNVTINLVNGTFQNINVNSATTITLPNSVAGKSFTIQTYFTSNSTITLAGGTSLKWASNTTPTATAVTGKVDIYNFMQDGNVTYGAIFGQNY